MVAAHADDAPKLRALLDAGASLNLVVPTKQGGTKARPCGADALALAALGGHVDAVDVLLGAGATTHNALRFHPLQRHSHAHGHRVLHCHQVGVRQS
jgi:hypothetical protein